MNQSLPKVESAIVRKAYPLTFVSPMAMHGANPKGDAEFRTASLKGILRYWWRSLQLESNSSKLLLEEVQLFGGTETEYKRKSPVSFSLSQPIQGKKPVNVLPHRTKSSGDPKRGPVTSKVVEANTIITINMQTLKKNKDSLSTYEIYLNYMLHLAGMGQRARRGFGACQWENHQWENPTQFSQSLKEALTAIGVEQQFVWNEEGPCLLQRKSSVQVKHPVLGAVYIGAGKDSVQEILTDIGRASHLGNPRESLGSAKPRWASPLWCTVREIGSLYYPIVTEMRTNGAKINNQAVYERDRTKFLQEVGVKL